MDKTDQTSWLSIGEAAKYLRVSRDTLRRWERNKIIKSYRSPTNHRYYKKEELEYVFAQKPEFAEETMVKEKPIQAENKKESRLSLVIVSLLSLYVVLMIFLAWLLLQSR